MRIGRFVLLVGLGVVWSCAPPRPPVGQTLPVRVNVDCSGPNVVFSVSPWRLELASGDEVVWQLADASQTIEIRKRQSGWPFDNNKYTGSQADPPTGKAMKGGQNGKTFRYAIAVNCQGGEGARRVELDPDLYIRR
jgi:hypothetical protein